MHYPQTRIIASYGKRLLDWLNIIPFQKKASSMIMNTQRYFFIIGLMFENGTTTVSVFVQPHTKVLIFFLKKVKKEICVLLQVKHVWIGMRPIT